MLSAVKYDTSLVVFAADEVEDFKEFRDNPPSLPDGCDASVADFIEMMTDARVKDFKIAPLLIECPSSAEVEQIINQLSLDLALPRAAREMQEVMIQRQELREELALDKAPDRRTIGEIHGLDKHDPWDQRSDEQKEREKKVDEAMRKAREKGGLTGDSFGGKETGKLTVRETTIKTNSNDDIVGVDIRAVKNSMIPFRLEIKGSPDFTAIFDDLLIPENRITVIDANTVDIMMHAHQVEPLTQYLESKNFDFTIRALDVKEATTVLIEDTSTEIFYSVQVPNAKVSTVTQSLTTGGIDLSTLAGMHDTDEGCWIAFAREKQAIEAAEAVIMGGNACTVVAINRQGQAILADAANGVRVVDTTVDEVQEPRPWNDRADEIAAMTDDEKAELFKGIKGAEFLFTAERHREKGTVVYIVPETYFLSQHEMWAGEMPIEHLLPENFLRKIEPGVYSVKSLEYNLVIANLARFGFVESLRLSMHLNDQGDIADFAPKNPKSGEE